MMPDNKYVALDIGSSAITAMAAEVVENNKIKILSVESLAANVACHGIIENPSAASYNVVKLTKLLKNSSKLQVIKHLSVGVNAKSFKNKEVFVTRFVKKEITEELLYDMHKEAETKIKGENVHIYDVIPVSYYLDEEKMDDPVGKTGVQLRGVYNVVFGNEIINEKIEGVFDRNDIFCTYKPLVIEALSSVLLNDSEREMGCILLNLGATTTTIGLYFEGVLQHLLVVPLGGRNVTKDISELGISEINAEKLKCLKGCALSSEITEPVLIQVKSVDPEEEPKKISTKFLSEVIEARLEEILQPLLKLLDNINYPIKAGIVLCGGASKLKIIDKFIEDITGLQVRFGNHNQWLEEDQQSLYAETTFSQLIGTIKLTHEYLLVNPPEEVKKKHKKEEKPTRGIKSYIFDFFSDENSLDEEKNKEQKDKKNQNEENEEK